jgi:hypothetical protein
VSWGAFGNALLGGHGAFRQALEDKRRQELVDLQERRLDEQVNYRNSRDQIEDTRYKDSLARQSMLDARSGEAMEYDRAKDQVTFAQESDSLLAPDAVSGAQKYFGGMLQARGQEAPLSGFAADANSIAGGSIRPQDIAAGYGVKRSPMQLAREAALGREARKGEREEAYHAELAGIDPKDERALWSVAAKYGQVDPENPADRAFQARQLSIQEANAAGMREDRADAREETSNYRREVLLGQARERVQRAFTNWQRQHVEATKTMPPPEMEEAMVKRLYATEPLLAGEIAAPAAAQPKVRKYHSLLPGAAPAEKGGY